MSDTSHLGFFGHSSADCPFCCTCFWRSLIGIDRYPGYLREVWAGFNRRPSTVRVRVGSVQELWVFRCWTQFFPQAPDFDPRGRVKALFRTPSPDRWRQAEDLCFQAQGRRWEGEFQKPLAFRPTAEATGTPQKKGGGDRQGKGQGDPVKTFNRFGSLEDDTGMEVEAPQTSLPSFLSGSTSSLK